jgi:hypothetical protein
MGEEESRLEGKEPRDRSAWEAATASCCAVELLRSGATLLLPAFAVTRWRCLGAALYFLERAETNINI